MREKLLHEPPIQLFTVNLSSKLEDQLRVGFHLTGDSHRLKNTSDFFNQSNKGEIQLFLIQDIESQFNENLEFLKEIKKINPSMVMVIVDDKISVQQFSGLINELKVFSVISSEDNLFDITKQAFDFYKKNADYYKNLNNLKKQNNQLENLNKNLETHVFDRTKKEFEANKQTETSLKNIQSLLNFIKNISRIESIEDFINQIRQDFKKYHGLMPPILLLESQAKLVRIFYYQGKQFTERKGEFALSSKETRTNIKNDLRLQMSHLLGRPFGQLTSIELSFKSQELDLISTKLIFEHSLDEKDSTLFLEHLKERTSLMNMALENILLKESLQNIAKQWAKTFNQMKDPIVIVDQNKKVTLSNSYYDKAIRDHINNSTSKKAKIINDSALEKTFNLKVSQVTPLSFMGKVYKIHSYPIRLANSETVSHVINQYVDITQFVDLQSKVIQGEKMAAIGLLAGNIAHELNNPLTGIFSLSQLLLEDFDENTNTYKDLKEVKEAAARCQRIIKDLLEFSNFGSDSKIKQVDLNEVVAKTMPLLKMATRTLNTDIQPSEEPTIVHSNPQLLQQVVFNLVNNACQAMDDGGHLTLITRINNNFGEIVIRDTGPGIPAVIRESIFDPFFTTKEEDKGTGLGLSMSKSVIERYKGTLSLNIDYKDGTEFIISLPLVSS